LIGHRKTLSFQGLSVIELDDGLGNCQAGANGLLDGSGHVVRAERGVQPVYQAAQRGLRVASVHQRFDCAVHRQQKSRRSHDEHRRNGAGREVRARQPIETSQREYGGSGRGQVVQQWADRRMGRSSESERRAEREHHPDQPQGTPPPGRGVRLTGEAQQVSDKENGDRHHQPE
jgi:hypothetical protein